MLSVRTFTYLAQIVGALCVFPDDAIYFGRFDFSTNNPTADWPGSRISFFIKAQATNATVDLTAYPEGEIEDFEYYVGVEVNCALLGKFDLTHSSTTLRFSFDTTVNEEYEISLTKLTEASLGAMSLGSLQLENSELLSLEGEGYSHSSCHSRDKHMLVVGDSITAAYGVEGQYPCTFSAETENIFYSYATLVGQSVGVDVHTIAWSGKGVVRNYGDPNPTSPDPMPLFYNRTLAISDDPSLVWATPSTTFTPDVVLVTLGSNDYSTNPHPSDADFTAGYRNLIVQIQDDYPDAKIAAICEPVPGEGECENIQSIAAEMYLTYIRIDDSIYTEPYGCDYHPSVQGQQNIADIVAPVVQAMLAEN